MHRVDTVACGSASGSAEEFWRSEGVLKGEPTLGCLARRRLHSKHRPQRSISLRSSGLVRCIARWMSGGEEGIRTPGSLPTSTVFKTAALNHSATSPTHDSNR